MVNTNQRSAAQLALANTTLNCPSTVVGGDRPKSTMLYLKRGKSNTEKTKRFVPEDYFKKCGYKYNPTQAQVFT
jgi:hypothetical protein